MSRERNDMKRTLDQHPCQFPQRHARKSRVPAGRREPTAGQKAASGPLRRVDIRNGPDQTEFASSRMDRFATLGAARLVYFSL